METGSVGTMKGRTLAIGDVHGCSRALDTLLNLVAPTEQDTLVFLGDYIDRGPDARGVLERVCGLALTHTVVALLGNHEIMMLGARRDLQWARDWLRIGGLETLDSYHAQTTRDIPASHWSFLEKTCRFYYETPTHIFVHAGVDAHLAMADQTEESLFWVKFGKQKPHVSGKTVICGHTAQKAGRPVDRGYAICIDTWVYGKGWLTCLDVESKTYWQANQAGETRTGEL